MIRLENVSKQYDGDRYYFRDYTLRGQDWHIFKALELMNE
jgi:hypothetical protein